MVIYNVLFKGVEKSTSFCKAFADFSEAQKWIEEDIESNEYEFTEDGERI